MSEAASCHFKNVSPPVVARIFKTVVKTPTFLSLRQSDLSTKKTPKTHTKPKKQHQTQNHYDVTGVNFRSPELGKDLLNSGTDTVTPLSVLPPSGKLWINLSKRFSWLAQVYQWQKIVSDAQISNAIPRLGGYIINSSHYYHPLTINFFSETLVETSITATYTWKKPLKWYLSPCLILILWQSSLSHFARCIAAHCSSPFNI